MANISVKLVLLALLLCVASLTYAQHDHDLDHSTTSSHHGHDHGSEDDHDDHGEGEPSTSEIWAAFGITCFAGCAAFIGSLSMFCVKREQIGAISVALAFAGAIVVYLAFMALIPECVAELTHSIDDAEDKEGLIRFYTLLCVTAGVGIAALMEFLFERYGMHHHHHAEDSEAKDVTAATTETTSTEVEMANDGAETEPANVSAVTSVSTSSENAMINNVGADADASRISYVVAFALILHHFPEGIATFISLYYDFEFGVLVAFALAIHDIPSGVCIAVPTYVATGSRRKPLLLCLIAALAYPLGALVGLLVVETAEGSTVDAFIGVLFGVTGGIMLYIAFVELLPSAIISATDAAKRGHKKVYGWALAAIFVGFLVMDVSSIILAETGGHSH